MAISVWTPADGFTRKPTVTEPPKPSPPPAQPSKAKLPSPSVIRKQRAYWLKQNRLSPQDLTIADQYLLKQAKTKTPMVFVGYGRVYCGIAKSVWRYFLRVFVGDKLITAHKLNLSLYYKQADAPAVAELLFFDASWVRERPTKKLSERNGIDLSALERNATVTLTLRTGHTLTGIVRWVSRYDVGLTLSNGAKVHVFKHAISDRQPQR